MKSTSLLVALATSLCAGSALANPSLPAPSPRATVKQTVGINEVSVDYSSPGMKGRKIFGGLLPFGQLWRFGADAATKLTLTRDATSV